ncbi:CLUMA_CG009414, isoform A [Clunio marinus]|uniref:CLUMA_CG009414, isoform A n=1 Tax=Clunio marinus TaxID=568069 RepID=A0A1J1I6Q5_9DIPT|nr:CLUMA_CG009414, isoform A [Clunio marinus]
MSLSRLNPTKKVIASLIARSSYNRMKFARHITTATHLQDKIVMKTETKNEWNRALSEAEKIVGYQTSYLSLRYLLSDEITNLAMHMRKLVGSTHPLVGTGKSLIYGQGNMQTWGLIVLLVSKMAGHAKGILESEQDKSAGVLMSQRTLAEVVEMVRTANMIHSSGVLNLQHLQKSGNDLSFDSDLIFGNKIALLGGDILLGNASTQMAQLKNQEVVELMCTAARDISDSHFIGERDVQNNPLPSDPSKKVEEQMKSAITSEVQVDEVDNRKPFNLKDVMGSPENEWTLRHTLANGTLLGKSCQSALLLAKQSEELQKQAYFFGKHLALAWQASIDLEPYKTELPLGHKLSLVSAPILFHLEYDSSLYTEIKKGIETVDDVNFYKIHKEVAKGPGLERTKELQSKHTLLAMTELYKFPKSDARSALENIILAMQED